ncbi:MAG TPA: alpha-ketoacid dehydrogenase subunit beta [Candidatus Acidoferrales bacterium]|nr:alpha-ketoacid dehydrogenase subunit beta [Candidatus Acidoferrales bacterium]
MMPASREITFNQAIDESLRDEMRKNPRVFLMGEDLGIGTIRQTRPLFEEFGPERVRDTPISEAGFIGAGVGAAITGMKPVVELMCNDFFGVAMDQIYNQAGKLRYMLGGSISIPFILRTSYGAPGSAAAHHSQSLYAIFAHVPGLKVVIPSTPYDGKGLMTTALRESDPVMFFEHVKLFERRGPVPEGEYTIPFGQAHTKREGSDVTVVAAGLMVHKALAAAEKLKDKVDVEVVDPRTIVPLDSEAIIRSVKKTNRLVIADEGYKRCGFAAEVAAIVAEEAIDSLDGPIVRVATPNVPIPFSPILEANVIPSEESIIRAVTKLVPQ